MSKILEYPNQTGRIPKGSVILCPVCKRDNYRIVEKIGAETPPMVHQLVSTKTGEAPKPTDPFCCQTCKVSLFRDGMAGLLLIRMG